MTKKGPIFIFRTQKPRQCLSEGLYDAAALACQTPSRCRYSRELNHRRVLALAMSLRDVPGAGSKGCDALTTDHSVPRILRALSQLLAQTLTLLGAGMTGSRGQVTAASQNALTTASPTAACSYSPGKDKRQPGRSFPYATLEEAKEIGKMPNRQPREQQKWKDSRGCESAVAGDSLRLMELHGPLKRCAEGQPPFLTWESSRY